MFVKEAAWHRILKYTVSMHMLSIFASELCDKESRKQELAQPKGAFCYETHKLAVSQPVAQKKSSLLRLYVTAR